MKRISRQKGIVELQYRIISKNYRRAGRQGIELDMYMDCRWKQTLSIQSYYCIRKMMDERKRRRGDDKYRHPVCEPGQTPITKQT